MPLDGRVIHVTALVHVAGRHKALGRGVLRLVQCDHLGKEGQRIGAFGLVGVPELRVERPAMLLVLQMIVDHGRPVQRDQHARYLVSLRKLVQSQRDHLFLAVAIKQDLLAEARIPESSDDGPQVGQERVLGNHHGPGHPHVVVRMRAIPYRLGHGTAGGFGDCLGHPGHQERVLAKGLSSPMVLSAAHRDDEDIVDLEPLLNLELGHGLVVDTGWFVHVATRRRQFPFCHDISFLCGSIYGNWRFP